jgi:YHS domain-containing protein
MRRTRKTQNWRVSAKYHDMYGARHCRRPRGGTMVKDPVCGMMIDQKTAKGESSYKGQTYYFCAAICKTKFDQNPAKYVKN